MEDQKAQTNLQNAIEAPQNKSKQDIPNIPPLSVRQTSKKDDNQIYIAVQPRKHFQFNDQLISNAIQLVGKKFQKQEQENLKFFQRMRERQSLKPKYKEEPQKPKLTPEQIKKKKILKKLEPHLKNFKVNNQIYNLQKHSQCVQYRIKLKQALFTWLFYCINQLTLLKQEQTEQSQTLDYEQNKIINMPAKEQYAYVNSIATQIDAEFLRKFNQSGKQKNQDQFGKLVNVISEQLGQESNFPLRRRILKRQSTAKKLVTWREQDFYCPVYKNKLREKHLYELRQVTVIQRPVVYPKPQQGIEYYNYYDTFSKKSEPEVVENKEQSNKPRYRYIEEASFGLLKKFLKVDHIVKMRSAIALQNNQIQQKLLAHINKVFQAEL